jgi:hypothetical protein
LFAFRASQVQVADALRRFVCLTRKRRSKKSEVRNSEVKIDTKEDKKKEIFGDFQVET